MKKYLPYIIGALLIIGSIVVRGIIKWNSKQPEHEAREQQRQTSMENLKQTLSDWEDEQKENGVQVVIAEE
ncbi:hypothetical protein FACS1894176_06840 [Bacteroidia bacterium]|nr:hypothetical protein FACS1894176_06840 [Bacteroidia bacterium]